MLNKSVRLFYKDSECETCRYLLFDPELNDWDETDQKPGNGDHVIINGVEMIKPYNSRLRELLTNEEELWDGEAPAIAGVEPILFDHEQEPREWEGELAAQKGQPVRCWRCG